MVFTKSFFILKKSQKVHGCRANFDNTLVPRIESRTKVRLGAGGKFTRE